tara:strand:- start:4680 stop:8174 length:3495 start_codon:yes stop_codon:yes gene_type:complete
MSKDSGKQKSDMSDVAKKEEEILSFWTEHKIFEKSLEQTKGSKEYVFYDGPPFATGLPHYGHILASTIKDAVPRYQTMCGKHVPRRWGWDCHGLPIENIVEKELNVSGKKAIEEEVGITEFNRIAKSKVLSYADEWKKTVERIARWVDFDGSYKTMDNSYIESVWWALSEINKKDLLYEGQKVLLYCPRCETPVSKAETAMDDSYKEISEESVTVKFKVKDPEKYNLPKNSFILAWTTTPWTLIGNVALAVGKDIEYAVVLYNDGYYICAEDLVEKVFADKKYSIKKSVHEKDLIGIEYEPIYEVSAVKETTKKAWYIADADFVTTDEGTGIVHTAVMYGEDDYNLGQKLDLPTVQLLDEKGHFNDSAPEIISGQYFKKAEKTIKEDLEKRDLLFARADHSHSYPHCWRCDTQLFYNAISSWFIRVEPVRKKLIEENKKVHWVPEHLRDGRFHNIIESAPDWNISRNRFWASPLPIWQCDECKTIEVIGSVEELQKKATKGNNTYLITRHGEAESNATDVVSSTENNPHHLTEKGKSEVKSLAEKLSGENIDLIISSPFVRTRETAEIVAEEIGVSKGEIIYDDRIAEIDTGDFDMGPIQAYRDYFESTLEKFTKNPKGGGETLRDVKKRIGEFFRSIEEKYKDKRILIVSHEYPIWMIDTLVHGWDDKQSAFEKDQKKDYIGNAELNKIEYKKLPYDDMYELDLHRPYIDEIKLTCSACSMEMERVPQVADAWLESGSMPFAAEHVPFEKKEWFNDHYPGDFIAEYIAQTRTWFYYTHFLGVALFDGLSFRNVVTTGTVLALDGQKMSKSKKNFPDPWHVFNTYGVDAMRYYLLASPVMRSEDINFSEKELDEVYKKIILRLKNINSFYRLHEPEEKSRSSTSAHILDQWIISRMSQVVIGVGDAMDAYTIDKALKPIGEFIEDLSVWYVRRSRDRFKQDGDDRKKAQETFTYVLFTLAQIMAPFMPFVSEETYHLVKSDDDPESVHLTLWPEASDIDAVLISQMEYARTVVEEALSARQAESIKVRQPLAKLTLSDDILQHVPEILSVIADEVNVKEVVIDESQKEKIVLDTNITPKLQEEGSLREMVRNIQALRKKEKLQTGQLAPLSVCGNDEACGLVEKYKNEIKELAHLESISCGPLDGKDPSISDKNLSYTLFVEQK